MRLLFPDFLPMRRFSRRALVLGVIGIAVLAFFVSALVLYTRYFGAVSSSGEVYQFVVEPKTSYESIAQELKTAGYIRSMTALRIALSITGGVDGIGEGGYLISHKMDTWKIARVLSAEPYALYVSFPPGWRKEQTADYLAKELGWSEEEKRAFIDIHTAPIADFTEGVYPGGTYVIPRDEDAAGVAARLRDRFREIFAPFSEQLVAKNLSWSEAIIMASLIEREATRTDRALISGILWNRINDGMRLQVDATLQYIRGESGAWWPVPRAEDKALESPFNTYKNYGLPPHAIASPSVEAIEAAINPQKTNCLYYIHDADREIHCASTYEGHLRNVDRYLR